MSGPVAPHTYGLPDLAERELDRRARPRPAASDAVLPALVDRRHVGQLLHQLGGQALPLRVGVRERRALHGLRGHRDRQRLPARHLQQPLDEDLRGVDRVGDLGRRAPALGRPLLEQPQRVPVAVVDVVERGLLHRGGQRDQPGPRRGAHVAGDADDGGRVLPLRRAQIGGAWCRTRPPASRPAEARTPVSHGPELDRRRHRRR